MQAILLCGGFSTRLHPLTKNNPNALLQVAGRPVLDYVVEQLLTFDGLRVVHLVSNGRFAAAFYRWKESWQSRLDEQGFDIRVHVNGALEEEQRRGELGDLAFALRFADAGRKTAVLSGDTIYRFPLAPIWRRFLDSESSIVLAVEENHPQVLNQRSVLAIGEGGILENVRDPQDGGSGQWISPPLYFLQPAALSHLSNFSDASAEHDAIDAFVGYVAGREPVEVVRLPSRDWRLRLNTRYMLEKANEVLEGEPLMPESWGIGR